MRIAIMSTNLYPTPPVKEKAIYAPLWITYDLTEGLVKKGHKVFLFGSSDSKTSATLISNNLPSLKKNKDWFKVQKKLIEKEEEVKKGKYEFLWVVKWKEVLRENYELLLAVKLFQMAQKNLFDIIQFHSPLRLLHFASLVKTPVVSTVHDPLTHPFQTDAVKTICASFPKNIHFISLSNAQRKPLPTLNYAATIYNGIDTKKFSFSKKGGEFLAFAGRILPWKGAHIAVQVARKTGKKLKIAGKILLEHQDYWDKEIKPYLSRKITYEGMLNPKQMVSFYRGAEAFLMPILWPEPFGLVMTEAMACGTPVIGFRMGSVPEIVKDKKTGFIVKNTKEMIKAVKKIDQIDRKECRKWVEENFGLEKMIDNYEKAYFKILKKTRR